MRRVSSLKSVPIAKEVVGTPKSTPVENEILSPFVKAPPVVVRFGVVKTPPLVRLEVVDTSSDEVAGTPTFIP